uniref:Anaphase-promoting complex subunit 10 n=1 Tax=Piliocolobus tephrosceles TaxID=591936 RepID=A0A8C9GIW2_9PRIM
MNDLNTISDIDDDIICNKNEESCNKNEESCNKHEESCTCDSTNVNKKNEYKKKKKKNNLPEIDISTKYVEIGCLGYWELSSNKNRSDTKKLKDNNAKTYWQSSSLGPHTITIEFFRLLEVSKIYLLFNYSIDESYTPCEILINAGNDKNQLEYLCSTCCDIDKYSTDNAFWFVIDLTKILFDSYYYNFNFDNNTNINFLYCRCLQICIVSSQHGGKDTRIRQIKIFGPKYPYYEYDKVLI